MPTDFAGQITSARDGDRAAVEGLFARWRSLLWLQARTTLRSELSALVDPSDIVQESLAQAFRDLAQFRGQTEGEWVAWLRSIVAGQAAKAWRHHSAAKRAAPRQVVVTETFENGKAASPAEQLIDHEQSQRMAAAIAALPDAMREVVVRRVFDREPFESVARAVGRSPAAARVLWTRAVRRLRELLV